MSEQDQYIALYKGSLIPLHACLVGLTWGLHDYLITLNDEMQYIWTQKRSFGKVMFLWIRYYTLALLVFDVTQIHLFSRPGITNDNVCVAMDSVIRIVGVISLWSIEIIMQLRVYALYRCALWVAIVNGLLFLGSIAGFSVILIHNALRRRAVIADVIHLPLPGCPSVHSGIEWAQWVPATVFEGVLFGFALYKTVESTAGHILRGNKIPLYSILIRDNIVYFFGVTCLLVFNNLMVVGVTRIPWFSYSPFHAALGVLTTRMLINLRKTALSEVEGTTNVLASAAVGSIETWRAATVPLMTNSTELTTVGGSSGFQDGDQSFLKMGKKVSKSSLGRSEAA